MKNPSTNGVESRASEPKATAEGMLYFCPSLSNWFSIEAIDAHPRLSLEGNTVMLLRSDKVLEFAS